MNSKRIIVPAALLALILFGMWLPAGAAPAPQEYVTPTAQPDGRILYIVKGGDTCFLVAALHNISVEQLRQLNSKIDEGCSNLIEGDQLLIGLVGAAAATDTPGPSPTPLPPTVTPTPFGGTTEICVLLFNDINGDSLRQETEPAIEGGAVSVTEINGKYSDAQNTVINPDPEAFQGICFADVPEGTYNISVAIPNDYNPTTDPASRLEVKAGDRAEVPFGAQSTEGDLPGQEDEPGTGDGNTTSTVLGIFGALLLLGGGGLGWYAWRSGRPANRLGYRKDFLRK
jgi:hypothetical protein